MSSEDRRKRLIAILPHCLLNQNTVVKPLASHEGAVKNLVEVLVEEGYGIVQLPCPETIYLGLRRWWMSREQYDTEMYKEFARKLLEPYISLLKELVKDGCRYILLGVRGSPSCGVEVTSSNPEWSGKPLAVVKVAKVKGTGVFMEELLKLLEEKGLPKPVLITDIDHREISEKGVSVELVELLRRVSRS